MDSDGRLRVLELKIEHYESLCREQSTRVVELEVQVRYLQEQLARNGPGHASHASKSNPLSDPQGARVQVRGTIEGTLLVRASSRPIATA